MPYIQLRDRQYPLGKGQLRVGTGAHADVRVPGVESDAPQAVVEVGADEQATVRRGSPDAVVKVNGVLLGVEPTPLIHGDKIEIGGVELLFGDDRSAGSTQYIGMPRAASSAAGAAPARVTGTTGGRLVSLVDGREYMVGEGGLTIGRDASCEVVVPSTEVSRRHANIAPAPGGYILTDLSTNGVLVNGERVPKTRTLGRGDMIRIGGEEFRFHADPAPGQPDAEVAPLRGHMNATIAHPAARISPAPASHTPATPLPRTPAAPPEPAPVHPAALAEAATGAPAGQGAVRARAPLAVAEIVNEGILKGKRFEIFTPLTHVGRGPHNDIAIPDDSVSDSHAKIQKRETGWFVVDMDSTNGTYVGGRRINGERQLIGSPDIRFGGIKMTFQVAADPVEDVTSTRAITGIPRGQPRPAAPAAPVAAASVVSDPVEPPPAGRGLGWVWLAIVVLVIGSIAFVLWGRG